MTDEPETGLITWFDLTVENAEEIRDFYQAVTGWSSKPVSMGEYSDFNMLVDGIDDPVAGICHARGVNKTIPSQWMMYIQVDDLDSRLEACRNHGGEIVHGPIEAAGGRIVVIRDPAGAVCALFQAAG
jgi:uncharacterized protein